MRKVSLIATTFNEHQGLDAWLAQLRLQTRLPDEIVICDAGSGDGTFEQLSAFAKDYPELKVTVLSKPGANIASGRNAAIAAASGEVIAVTDCGSVPETRWLAELLKPFQAEPQTQVVAGYYRFLQDTLFRRAAAGYLGQPWEAESFIPSARSIAFTKEIWRTVDGYPEWLTQAAEDTLFFLNLERAGARIRHAPEAIVLWNTRPSLRSFLRMIRRNAAGEAETGLYRSAAVKTLIKLLLQGALLALATLLLTQFYGLSTGLLTGGELLLLALAGRALWRGVPPLGWPYFWTLCLLGGVTYLRGYWSGTAMRHHSARGPGLSDSSLGQSS